MITDIDSFIEPNGLLHERMEERLLIELERQKKSGKKFISNREIDSLIDKVMKEEIDNPTIIKKQKEFILCSAINYNGTIICGRRHGDCYTTLKELLSKYISPDDEPQRKDQGFLTSLNRYVDRKEAWQIAKANNQIQYGYEASIDNEEAELTSENLY